MSTDISVNIYCVYVEVSNGSIADGGVLYEHWCEGGDLNVRDMI